MGPTGKIPQALQVSWAMLEYFALNEEKVDGPAALIFTDGQRIGASLTAWDYDHYE